MNAKQVLSKVAKLLNLEEVELTYAKLADGTIVESATFDVGEDLFVVSEDGTKSPAPNGTHDLMLRDEEGNENLIKVRTEDGKIVERENVELAKEDTEDVKTEQLPGDPTKVNDVVEEKSAGEQVDNLKTSANLAEVTEEVEPLPTTGDGMETESEDETPSIEIELGKKMEEMAYRISELEKMMEEFKSMKEVKMSDEEEVAVEEDVELPKLDGAPVDTQNFSAEENKTRFGKKANSSQATFLSKLYK
jgi:hypothetical protein